MTRQLRNSFRGLLLLSLFTGAAFAQADPLDPAAPMPMAPMPMRPGAAAPAAPVALPPAVQAVLASNPTTAEQLVEAAVSLVKFNQPALAADMLKKLNVLDLTRENSAKLVRRFGAGVFLGWRRNEKLQPLGEKLGKTILEETYAYTRDPIRLEQLVKDIANPDYDKRNAAIAGLKDAEEGAINPILEVLADPAREAEHSRLRTMLVLLGEQAIEPMMPVLEAQDSALRIQAMAVLARLKSTRSILFMLQPAIDEKADPVVREVAQAALKKLSGSVPTDAKEVARLLYVRAGAFFAGEYPLKPDGEGMVTQWSWDEAKKRVQPVQVTAESAALHVATQLAAQAYQLEPKNIDYRRLYLATLLESAKLQGGLDAPLAKGPGTPRAIAGGMGIEAVEAVLAFAQKTGHTAAVIAAAEVLGDIGNTKILAGTAAGESPLVAALRNSNRRVRLVAAQAILKIGPDKPFAGASNLPEALAYLAASSGTRRAIIATPKASDAQAIIGMFREVGFTAEHCATGREMVEIAIRSPDVELVLVSDFINKPVAHEAIQLLRQDCRGALMPVGLMAHEDNLQRARQLAYLDPRTEVFVRPTTSDGLQQEVSRLLKTLGSDLVPLEERRMQAIFALDALAKLAADPHVSAMYDLLRFQHQIEVALSDPQLSARAAKVLGLIGSAFCQRSLVELASQNALPIAQRIAAKDALKVAVARRGLMLTSAEILRQYDRFNQSEALGKETQQVLGAVLDIIEDPSKKAAAQAEPGPHPVRKSTP